MHILQNYLKTIRRYVFLETFLEQKDAICFVEDQDVTPYLPEIDTIILFHGTGIILADFFFTVDLSEWNRIHQEEFAGKSHEKITMEVYKK